MKIIVGLGNPGKEYQYTRHNAGFMVIEELAKGLRLKAKSQKQIFKKNKKVNAEISELEYQEEKVILVKPLTFMNESGTAVRKIIQLSNCPIVQLSNSLWVVHDDLDLALGEIKIVKNRGAAGHHGVESIINHLKTRDFVRFRIGIAVSSEQGTLNSQKDYVLGEFKGDEKELFQKAIERCRQAVVYALENGIDKTMREFN